MANDLVPQPGRPGADGRGNGHQPLEAGKVYDPLVAAGFVDTDSETAGMEWDLPPAEVPWEGFEAARQARRAALKAEEDAAWARRHGLIGFAILRESDAADSHQSRWDWGDLRTWAIIGAMFFGLLLVVAAVYFMPHGRHNQNDGPLSVPNIRVY